MSRHELSAALDTITAFAVVFVAYSLVQLAAARRVHLPTAEPQEAVAG